MIKPKVYLETSVISYLTARPSRDLITAAHRQITHEWWENYTPQYDLFISQLVIQEVTAGDVQAATRRLQVLNDLPLLAIQEDARTLTRLLVQQGGLPARAVEDALHIAIATVHGMDYLVTWNCKHIANATTRNTITDICQAQGYEPPVICTPEELMGG